MEKKETKGKVDEPTPAELKTEKKEEKPEVQPEPDKVEERFKALEEENKLLRKANDELKASVEGVKADVVKLADAYKEQFTKPNDNTSQDNDQLAKKVEDDIFASIVNVKY